jgi:branched-chain amino acid transport system permease protein
VFIKPVVGKDASNYIVLTFGLSYLLQNLVQFFLGANFKSLPIDRALKIGVFQIGELVLLKPRVIAFGIVLVFVVLVFIFLNKTNTGRAMRATAESIEISETLGINTKKSFMAAFAIGTMFAGVAGMLLTPIYYVYPRVGVLFSMTATSCLVLGGLGNITGALVGGLLIGLVEAFTTTYIDGNLAPVSINLVLILVLVFKPTGLFGRRMRSA